MLTTLFDNLLIDISSFLFDNGYLFAPPEYKLYSQ